MKWEEEYGGNEVRGNLQTNVGKRRIRNKLAFRLILRKVLLEVHSNSQKVQSFCTYQGQERLIIPDFFEFTEKNEKFDEGLDCHNSMTWIF